MNHRNVKFVTATDRKRAYNFCIHLRDKVSNYKPGEGAKIWDRARQTYRRQHQQTLLKHVLPKQMTIVAVAAPPPPLPPPLVGLTATYARNQHASPRAKSNYIVFIMQAY
jgi:hypothetical protein